MSSCGSTVSGVIRYSSVVIRCLPFVAVQSTCSSFLTPAFDDDAVVRGGMQAADSPRVVLILRRTCIDTRAAGLAGLKACATVVETWRLNRSLE
jgi:hypothetical protein